MYIHIYAVYHNLDLGLLFVVLALRVQSAHIESISEATMGLEDMFHIWVLELLGCWHAVV